MWLLEICLGYMFGLCGSTMEVRFPTKEDCHEERRIMVESAGDKLTYAICIPPTTGNSAGTDHE